MEGYNDRNILDGVLPSIETVFEASDFLSRCSEKGCYYNFNYHFLTYYFPEKSVASSNTIPTTIEYPEITWE